MLEFQVMALAKKLAYDKLKKVPEVMQKTNNIIAYSTCHHFPARQMCCTSNLWCF